MRKIIVAGINGFVGGHLAQELHNRKIYVIGIGTEPGVRDDLSKYVDQYVSCDLSDIKKVGNINFSGAKTVINLAGFANVGASFDQRDLYMRVNVDVHTNIAKQVKKLEDKSIRLISVSTGSVYDNYQKMPLDEGSKITSGVSPYADSKIAMENSMNQFKNDGLDIVIVRPFNHTGPGQRQGFLIPDLANQILSTGKLKVGNLTTRRDYTDVRDVVRAYSDLALAETLNYDLYNICSSRSFSGQEILEIILDKLKKSDNVVVEVDKSKIRPNDPPEVIGNNSRIKNELSWSPKIPIEQTIEDYLAWLKTKT